MVAEGGFYQISNKFWDPATIVPLFIMTYAGNMTVLGLSSTLSRCIGVFLTLILGVIVWRIKNLAKFQFYIMLLRGLPLLLVPILLLALSAEAAIIAFMIIYTIVIGSVSIQGVTWWDIMGRTIPQDHRGKLLGLQQVAGGIGGLATGFAIKAIIGSSGLYNPQRFSILFASVGIFGLASAFVMGGVKDPYRKSSQPAGNLMIYFRQFSHLLSMNPKYRRILLLQAIFSFVQLTFPFLILFQKQHFHLDDGQVSTLVFLQIIGTLVGGLVWGELSKRRGNAVVIRYTLLASLLVMTATIVCYFLGNSLTMPMAILMALSTIAGFCQMTFFYNQNYLVDITSNENRAVYLIMNTVLLFPFSFVSLLYGIIADSFGFLTVLSIGGLAALICLLITKDLLSPDKIVAWQEELKNRLH